MEHKFEPFERVLVRSYADNVWMCNLYSHSRIHEAQPYVCVWSAWKYCIPYAGNEHLLGTTDSPEKKHEYEWGEVVEVKHLNMEWMKGLYVTKIHDGRHQVVLHDKYNTNKHIFEYYLDEKIRPVKRNN